MTNEQPPQRIEVAQLRASLREQWPQMAAEVAWAVPYLYRLRDRLYDDLCRRLAPFGWLPADLDLLLALRTQPPPRQLTPTQLYRSLFLSSGGMTKILKRLEQRQLVDRPENPADGRSRLVRLTATGERQLAQVMAEVVAHQRQFMAALEEPERRQLTHLLGALVATGEPTEGAVAP
jgi:DNA-binding MarR family transcriptional regulator